MIEITDLQQSPFPTIDFKFLNRGDASGVLWQIGVLIESIEIDPTPVISFGHSVEHRCLALLAKNTGWGPANSLRLQASEPLLGQLFPTGGEGGPLTVGDGNRLEVLKWFFDSAGEGGLLYLDGTIRERAAFLETLPSRMREGDRTLLEEAVFAVCLCNHERWHIQEYFDDLARGQKHSTPRQQWHIEYMSQVRRDAVALQNITIHSSFEDIHGRTLEHDQSITFGTTGDSQAWITMAGFELESYDPPLFSLMPPTVTFVVMLDAAAGPIERKYSTSLKIPAGDAERFQIAIGADRSCHVRARFLFYFDDGHTIPSNAFDVTVWRPREMRVYAENGAQIVRTENGWRLADRSGSVKRGEWFACR